MNWDKVCAGVVAALLCLFLCLAFGVPQQFIREHEAVPVADPKPAEWPANEVMEIVQGKYQQEPCVAEISPKLALLSVERPLHVLVCLVIAQDGHGFPPKVRLSEKQRKTILSMAERDSEAAIEELKDNLRSVIDAEIVALKLTANKENRRAKYGGIPAASLLFLDYPLAKEHKIEYLLVGQELRGYKESIGGWWESAGLSKDQYLVKRWQDMPER